MAARFWVPVAGVSTGNWNDTSHWATTSGGAGGAAVPTSSDDVTFDSNSGTNGTVTVNVAANALTLTLNKSDLTMTQTAGLTVVGVFTHTTGSWTTGGSAVSLGSYSSSNSNARTFTPGASAITITAGSGATGIDVSTATNLTITANTAVVTFTGSATVVFKVAINQNFNGISVVYTGGNGSLQIASGSGATFRNVTVTPTVSADGLSWNGTLFATGVLALNGTEALRVWLRPNSAVGSGATSTLSLANAPTLTYVDFMDIIGAGTAAPFTGTRLASVSGSSSGITFDAPVTRYLVGVASGTVLFTDKTHWSTSTGGASGASMPTCQDTVIVDANSVSADGAVLSINVGLASADIDFSAMAHTLRTNVPQVPGAFCGSVVGNLKLTWGNSFVLYGRGARTFDPTSATGMLNITVGANTGTYTWQANHTVQGTQNITINNGTVDANGHSISIGSFVMNGALGAVRLSTNTWTLKGTGTVWNVTTGSVTAGTATIVISDTSATGKTFASNSLTYPTLQHTSTGAGGLTFTGSPTFAALDLECSTARTVTLPANGTISVTNSLTIKGASGQLLSFVSSTPGTQAKLKLTSCSGTLVNQFTSLSSDILLTLAVCGPTNTLPVEALYSLRAPNILRIATEEAPVGLLSITQGCVVAVVITGFASGDSLPANAVVFSLDDGTNNERIQYVWGNGNKLWEIRRADGGASEATMGISDTFAVGARRMTAMAWSATITEHSINGAAWTSHAATVFPTGIKHLMLGRAPLVSPTGSDWNGTVVWIAGFSAPLASADIATLFASFATIDPQFQQLPGSPTFLWTNASGILVTASTPTTTSEQVETLAAVSRSALDPAESLAAASAAALDPLEALAPSLAVSALEPIESLLSPTRAALDPFETLVVATKDALDPLEATIGLDVETTVPFEDLANPVAEAHDPLESLVSGISESALDPFESTVVATRTAVEPVEALAGPAVSAVEPLESVGLAASARVEPFEAVVGVSEERLLPFASNPVPKKGKAVGETARTAAGEGQQVRLSSITNVEGGL